MSPEDTAKFDQSLAGVDTMIDRALTELKNQLSEGHSETDIMIGFHDFLTNYLHYTKGEYATLYMRAMVRLAKSDDRI